MRSSSQPSRQQVQERNGREAEEEAEDEGEKEEVEEAEEQTHECVTAATREDTSGGTVRKRLSATHLLQQ